MRLRSAFVPTLAAFSLVASTGGVLAQDETSDGIDCTKVTGKVVWWTEQESPEGQAAQDEIFVQGLEAAYPGIDLELVYQGEDMRDVVRTAVQGGAGPDIVQTPGPSFVRAYEQAGSMEPLDAYADAFGWRDVIAPWALSVGVIDGELYSVPLTYESAGMLFYNPIIFRELGLEPPTDLASMEAVVAALKAADLEPFTNGAVNDHIFPVFLAAIAGNDAVYEVLTGQVEWTDPRIADALTTYNDWLQDGWFAGSAEKYLATDWNGQAADFAAGTGGMLVQGTWMISIMPAYTEDSESWDFVEFPALREGIDGSAPLGIGSTLSINSGSENKDAAACVLDFLYSDKDRAAALVASMQGEWNVPIDLTGAAFPEDIDPRLQAHLEGLAEDTVAGRYGYAPWTFYPVKTRDIFENQISRVFTGEMTPDEILALAAETFAEEMAAGEVPPVPER